MHQSRFTEVETCDRDHVAYVTSLESQRTMSLLDAPDKSPYSCARQNQSSVIFQQQTKISIYLVNTAPQNRDRLRKRKLNGIKNLKLDSEGTGRYDSKDKHLATVAGKSQWREVREFCKSVLRSANIRILPAAIGSRGLSLCNPSPGMRLRPRVYDWLPCGVWRETASRIGKK